MKKLLTAFTNNASHNKQPVAITKTQMPVASKESGLIMDQNIDQGLDLFKQTFTKPIIPNYISVPALTQLNTLINANEQKIFAFKAAYTYPLQPGQEQLYPDAVLDMNANIKITHQLSYPYSRYLDKPKPLTHKTKSEFTKIAKESTQLMQHHHQCIRK